jgi:general stress protein 26
MASKGSTNTDRVWEIIETVGIAMLTTSFPGGLRARPVEARPERDAGLIWFVTDLRSRKEHEIEPSTMSGSCSLTRRPRRIFRSPRAPR